MNETQTALELDQKFQKHGFTGIERTLRNSLNEWKSIPLHVAITGECGSGKSSFINAIRDLSGDDDGAAAVGVTETTTKATPYPHPDNENCIFWDLPGVGTDDFPRDQYLEKVMFEKYDFFLIFSATRFSENDTWLGKSVKNLKKKCYFVHTKIDDQIASDKTAHPKSHTEEKVVSAIRTDCSTKFRKNGLANVRGLFLVNNFDRFHWDFPKLVETLVADLEGLKQESTILTLQALTTDSIKAKRKLLQKRIWKVAALSGLGGAVPVPGVSFAVDTGLLVSEYFTYQRRFGLDEKTLQQMAHYMDIDVPALLGKVGIKTTFHTVGTIGALLARAAVSEAAESAVSIALPIIGSLIGAGLSFGVTYTTLNGMLNDLERDALLIMDVKINRAKNYPSFCHLPL